MTGLMMAMDAKLGAKELKQSGIVSKDTLIKLLFAIQYAETASR